MSRKTKDTRNIRMSDFYCTCCGNKGMPIFRTVGQEREPGHLKKIFCIYCNKQVNMAEVKNVGKYHLDDFWLEYEYGNFDKEGNRKEPWKSFTSKKRQELQNEN